MIDRNAELSQEKRIEFRVGINVGDIIIDRGDIFGDGVNIAARLEGIAEPGGICLSEDAYRQMSGKVQIPIRDLGPQSLKNIAQPVRAYSLGPEAIAVLPAIVSPVSRSILPRTWWAAAGLLTIIAIVIGGAVWRTQHAATPPVASLALGDHRLIPPERLSIVVLPFTNLSGDLSQDYLADAITDGLTTSLSRIAGSFVIARSTAFAYKGKVIDAKQIAKDLAVRYVLEGSAQPSGNRVRVNAQLISAETGAHLWADQLDADRADLLQMQDEIVTHLARTLEVQLWKIDAARVDRIRPANLSAEDLAMRCLSYNYGNEFHRAYELCDRALQLDPNNALALTTMAHKFLQPVLVGQSTDPTGDLQRADELVKQAIAAEPNLAFAHHTKALMLLAQKRHEEALVEAERSLALNPSFVDTYQVESQASNMLGRPEKALEFADKAIRLSPRDPYLPLFYLHKAWAYFLMQRDEQAIEWMRRALTAWPEFALWKVFLAGMLAANGRDAEAQQVIKDYLSLNGVKMRTISAVTAFLSSQSGNSPSMLANQKRFEEGLRRAGMPEE